MAGRKYKRDSRGRFAGGSGFGTSMARGGIRLAVGVGAGAAGVAAAHYGGRAGVAIARRVIR